MEKIIKLIAVLVFAGASMVAMEEPSLDVQLITAIQEGNRDEVERLLNQGADPVATHALWYAAVHRNRRAICELLIEKGANREDLNLFGKTDQTPLMIVAANGDLDMVKFLIENGADIAAARKSSKWTVLMDAAYSNELIKIMLTTIPYIERQKILAKRAEIRARIDAASMAMKRTSSAVKDVRQLIGKMIYDLEIQGIVDEQLARVQKVMRMKNDYEKTARDEALRMQKLVVADLLDPNNPETIAWLRAELEKNIRQIFKQKPSLKAKPTIVEECTVETEDPFGSF